MSSGPVTVAWTGLPVVVLLLLTNAETSHQQEQAQKNCRSHFKLHGSAKLTSRQNMACAVRPIR
jgi:hypothetical protein